MTPEMRSQTDRIDELFGGLSHTRRRQLLEVVAAGSTPIPLDSVAEGIATAGSDVSSGSSAVDSTDDIVITLVHSHIPILVESDIIKFDDEATMITEGDRFERALDHLVRV